MIGGNTQYIEAEIDNITIEPTAADHGIRPGQQLPNTPKWKSSVWATYTWPVQFIAGAEMFVRGQASFTDKTHTRFFPAVLDEANPSFTYHAYTLAFLRIGLTAPDGSWQIDMFGTNLPDERAQLFQGGTVEYQLGRTGDEDIEPIAVAVGDETVGLSPWPRPPRAGRACGRSPAPGRSR